MDNFLKMYILSYGNYPHHKLYLWLVITAAHTIFHDMKLMWFYMSSSMHVYVMYVVACSGHGKMKMIRFIIEHLGLLRAVVVI